MNTIKTTCNFCNRPIELSADNRFKKCPCGVQHTYKPNVGKPPSKKYRTPYLLVATPESK